MSVDTFYFMRLERRHGSRVSIEDVKLVHCFLSWIPVVMINNRKNNWTKNHSLILVIIISNSSDLF